MGVIENMKDSAKPVLYGKNGIVSNPPGFFFWCFVTGAASIVFGSILMGALQAELNGD